MPYAKLMYIYLRRDNDTTTTTNITGQGDYDHKIVTDWDTEVFFYGWRCNPLGWWL